MLFSEVYGSYYETVGAILTEAARGPMTTRRMQQIVREHGFGESALSIPRALESGDWPLLGTVRHAPPQPLTTLEKRWMKALLLDRRMKLFDLPQDGLEGVEPLFTPEMFDWYDRYADGDPYEDEAYIAHFRTLMDALRAGEGVCIRFVTRLGEIRERRCTPLMMEYSEKDDKFRVVVSGGESDASINVARVLDAVRDAGCAREEMRPVRRRQAQLVFELRDERNALERVMMHFSPLRKETARVGENLYRVTLHYDAEDETEILIRILSFGPVIRVLEPQAFCARLRERLARQAAFSRRYMQET